MPIRPGGGSAYEKVERRVGDWAVAAAGAAVWLDGDTVADVGIGLTAVGARALRRAREAEDCLRGAAGRPRRPSPRPAGIAAEHCNPAADQRGPVDYKRHLAGELTTRALRRAAARARGGAGGLTCRSPSPSTASEYTRDVEPRLLLVHFLRDELGPDRHPLGLRHVQLRHLRRLARRHAGQVLHRARGDGRRARGRTVEGLERDGRLDPVQQGFIDCHGLQCGFCTPGMMMTARWLLDHNPDPSEAEIREAISGQLCRCTGYENIVRSVRWAAEHTPGRAGARRR